MFDQMIFQSPFQPRLLYDSATDITTDFSIGLKYYNKANFKGYVEKLAYFENITCTHTPYVF